jgi:hypothetical protein
MVIAELLSYIYLIQKGGMEQIFRIKEKVGDNILAIKNFNKSFSDSCKKKNCKNILSGAGGVTQVVKSCSCQA